MTNTYTTNALPGYFSSIKAAARALARAGLASTIYCNGKAVAQYNGIG